MHSYITFYTDEGEELYQMQTDNENDAQYIVENTRPKNCSYIIVRCYLHLGEMINGLKYIRVHDFAKGKIFDLINCKDEFIVLGNYYPSVQRDSEGNYSLYRGEERLSEEEISNINEYGRTSKPSINK